MNSDFKDVLRALSENNAEYLIVGGYAVMLTLLLPIAPGRFWNWIANAFRLFQSNILLTPNWLPAGPKTWSTLDYWQR